ncbi:hypothetical protein FRB99_001524, partial [Tulasnella sp. 403]
PKPREASPPKHDQPSHSTTTKSKTANAEDDPSNYVFFFTAGGENGWASQWYWEPFEGPARIEGESPLRDGEPSTLIYFTAENFMMYHKAILFEDYGIAGEILGCSDPHEVKKLGRQVENFDHETWEMMAFNIALEGNKAKFRSSAECRRQLLETGDKLLVEASPYDNIWGIGFSAEDALARKSEWGMNMLGQVLVTVREMLRKEE